MKSYKYALTGATGFIGREISLYLSQKGCNFSRLVRHVDYQTKDTDYLFDLNEPHKLSSDLLIGIDCIIHTAALVHKANVSEKNFELQNVEATRQLVLKSIKAGVKHFIFLSSVAVYGKNYSDKPIDDTAPTNPQTPYGISKLQAENTIIELLKNSPISYTILRIPLVYGKNNPGNFGKLFNISQSLLPLPFLGKTNIRTMTSVTNLASFIIHASFSDVARNKIILFSDGSNFSTKDIILAIRHKKSMPRLLFYCPSLPIKLILKSIKKKIIYDQLYEDLVFKPSSVIEESLWKKEHEPDPVYFI